MSRSLLVGLGILLLTSQEADAQGKAKLAKEAAKYAVRTFGRDAAEQGVEILARRIEMLALTHGDEAFLAVKKVGPRTFRLVEEAGAHGLQSVKLMAKYGESAVWVVGNPARMELFARLGEEAAEVMMRHGEIAEPLLDSIGEAAVVALAVLSTRNGRRLAMMAEREGPGKTPALFAVIAKHGDRAMEYLWKNQQLLADDAARTSFLASPERFLKGVAEVPILKDQEAIGSSDVANRRSTARTVEKTSWPVGAVHSVGVASVIIVFCVRRNRRGGSAERQSS